MLAEEQSLMVCGIYFRVFVSVLVRCFRYLFQPRGPVGMETFPFMAALTVISDTQQLDQREIRIACISHQACSADMQISIVARCESSWS